MTDFHFFFKELNYKCRVQKYIYMELSCLSNMIFRGTNKQLRIKKSLENHSFTIKFIMAEYRLINNFLSSEFNSNT